MLHRQRISGRKPLNQALLLGAPVIFLAVIFFVPLCRMFWLSIWDGGITLAAYTRLSESPMYFNSLLWTLQLAFYTSLLCLIIGYPVAYATSYSGPRIRAFILMCIVLPF